MNALLQSIGYTIQSKLWTCFSTDYSTWLGHF